MSRSIMIIGGGRWQVKLIECAAAMGLRTVVTDRSPAAPGQSIADSFHCVDMMNVPALTDLARRERVSLVLSDQTDRAVSIVGRLNDELGTPGVTGEIADRFTDKICMRDCLPGSGVPMPKYRVVGDVVVASKAADEIGYPVIVKPPASQSSRGVFLVHSTRELAAVVEDTLAEGRGRALVEEFIDGPELTIDGICLAGRHYVLAMSEKAHYAHRPCVAWRLAFRSRVDGALGRKIEKAINLAVERLGLIDGITHAEVRLRDGVPYLIEIAARGCGFDGAAVIVAHVSGVDLYHQLISRLLGRSVEFPTLKHRAGLLEFFRFRPGTVATVEGLDEARRNGLAYRVEFPFGPGDMVNEATDDTNRPGHFVILGETAEDVEINAQKIRSLVRVRYVDEQSRQAVESV